MLIAEEVLSMSQDSGVAAIPLPKDWPEHARSAIVHVISLAHAAIVSARGRVASARDSREHLRAKLDNARAEIALLTEELRIKDARMASIDPRPACLASEDAPHHP